MKSARQLLEEFTASSFRDTKKASEMFAENGTFEMPYLESLGFPWRYEGREKVEGFFKFIRELYPDMDFHDVKIVRETPDVVVGEYEFTTKSSKTGRMIHQLFVGRLESENGKIKLLRESINLVELGLAIFPNGLADYKVPAERQNNL
jgi:ketosteroid isomerase-like protein